MFIRDQFTRDDFDFDERYMLTMFFLPSVGSFDAVLVALEGA